MQISFAPKVFANRKPAAPQGGGERVQSKQPQQVTTPAGDTFVRFSGCCG